MLYITVCTNLSGGHQVQRIEKPSTVYQNIESFIFGKQNADDNYSLHDLLAKAKDKSLTIPQFQRQFIWRESQVKLLIDSISRAYPIGSLLLLDKKPDLPLASRSIEAEIRNEHPQDDSTLVDSTPTTETESYILDGQQRTTSIARVFLNAHPTKLYYFDLERMFEVYDQGNTAWIRDQRRGKTAPDRKDNNKLLRADIVLDQAKADIYISEYIEDSGDFPQFEENRKEGRKAIARIKGVFETMRNYKVPVVTLERSSGIESVCRVFETINSTGTRLTTFDLAVARFYPKPDLRDLWNTALKEHSLLEYFGVDGERVLQVLYLVTSKRSEKSSEPTRKNLMELTSEEINQDWAKSSQALAETYKWARALGARQKTLPTHNILVALAAVRILFQDPWPNPDLMRRWYFSKIMQPGAAQTTNYRLAQNFEALYLYLKEGNHPEIEEVKLDMDLILRLRPSDVRYKSLQNVFATTIRQDLISGGNIDSESSLHDHHIFPKNAGKRHQLDNKMLDSICNRVPILAQSNQSLNEGYPQEYLEKMVTDARAQGTLNGLKRRLDDCMIPGDPHEPTWVDNFSIEKFEEFCRKRAKLILERVREVVGDSLRSGSLSEYELSEDDE